MDFHIDCWLCCIPILFGVTVVLAMPLMAILAFFFTAIAGISLVGNIISSFIGFATCTHRSVLISTMTGIFAFVSAGCSFMATTCGWSIWWLLVNVFHVYKDQLILGLLVQKWINLLLFYSALCFVVMLPRASVFFWVLEEHDKDVARLMEEFAGAVECGVLLLIELAFINYFPNWKHHLILIQVLVLFFLVVKVISVIINVVVYLLQVTFGDWKLVVYLSKGLRKNTSFLRLSTLLMVLWLCYFNPHFRQTGALSNRASNIVSWTFICPVIGSVFWLIKKCIVLLWTANAVYDRFRDKIVHAGIQFYLLLILSDKTKIQKKLDKSSDDGNDVLSDFPKKMFEFVQPSQDQHFEQNMRMVNNKRKVKGTLVRNVKISSLPTYELQRMTKYFQDIQSLLQDQVDAISKQFPSFCVDVRQKTIKSRDMGDDDDDAKALYDEIQKVDSTNKDVDPHKFRIWVLKAYKNCKELGHTLRGAEEVASYLNTLLIGTLLLMIIIIWLIATKIASLDLFIMVTSPILAANFIFGSTLRSIFQGVIFAFGMHLFGVGDVCVINGIEMEVEQIGIWQTIFNNVGTKEKLIYQNSVLANKVIITHRGGFDLNDSVEYCIAIDKWNPSPLTKLEALIEKYLVENSAKYKKHPLGVVVKDVGDNVKIVIHFKHDTSLQDMKYFEFRRSKSTNRAKLLLEVKNFIDGLKV